ncbi:MAG TPA: hypothetical protein VKU44_03910 [Terriglobia bacterium]|nr:hypothetical protein [Terriglobia bacterium]
MAARVPQAGGSESVQVVDRVVASIGGAAVTASDVQREYRLEILMEQGRLPEASPDAATFDRVRDRLIDQRLLGEEVKAEAAPSNGAAAAAESTLAEVRRKFPSPAAFDSALGALDLDETGFLRLLEEHERSLALVDRRLRPAASPDQPEIDRYYRETFLPEYAKRSQGGPPPLAEVESQIREVLVQQKIDQLLAAWLKELRSAHRVRVLAVD